MPDLPTLEDIQKLPRWARVAFAARCARRVQPLFAARRPGATAKDIAAVDHAISRAEQSAGGAVSTADAYVTAAGDAAQAYAAAPEVDAAALVARAATRAAYSTAAYTSAAAAAYTAYTDAAEATEAAEAAAAIRCDYDLLCALSQREAWDDDSPVPPALFGPLWPDGPPPGWPED